jgi:signal transduction histidine kinase
LIGRTDAGHREFRPGNVQLDALVTESVEAQRLRAKDGITVSLALPEKNGPARMDPRLIRHILDNLVSNGVKYSKPGGVVHVNVARDDDGMTLEVKDEGIGIPPEHLGRLFDSFSRAKNVGAVQGTGLGLAIVKRAVDQHSGTIRASSELGVGTTFVVRIPIERGLDSDAGAPARADAPKADGDRPKGYV